MGWIGDPWQADGPPDLEFITPGDRLLQLDGNMLPCQLDNHPFTMVVKTILAPKSSDPLADLQLSVFAKKVALGIADHSISLMRLLSVDRIQSKGDAKIEYISNREDFSGTTLLKTGSYSCG